MLGVNQIEAQLEKDRLHAGREGKGQSVLMVSGSPKGRKSKNPLFPFAVSRVFGRENKDLVPLLPELMAEYLDGGGEAIDQGFIVAGEDADLHGRPRTAPMENPSILGNSRLYPAFKRLKKGRLCRSTFE
jgi:hypothetical protein